jgi:hypothetical protein
MSDVCRSEIPTTGAYCWITDFINMDLLSIRSTITGERERKKRGDDPQRRFYGDKEISL